MSAIKIISIKIEQKLLFSINNDNKCSLKYFEKFEKAQIAPI